MMLLVKSCPNTTRPREEATLGRVWLAILSESWFIQGEYFWISRNQIANALVLPLAVWAEEEQELLNNLRLVSFLNFGLLSAAETIQRISN